MEHEQIERINELARKKKTVGLTEAEALEQATVLKLVTPELEQLVLEENGYHILYQAEE